jgi:hypothetical protein
MASITKVRKAFIPYNQQPPSFIQPAWGEGMCRGLLYAASIPYEVCHVRTKQSIFNSHPTGLPTYGMMRGLGKTQITPSGGAFGSSYPGLLSPTPPFTIMVGFMASTTPANFAAPIGMGGNSSGGSDLHFLTGGTTIGLEFNGVATYTLTGLASIATGTVYYLIASVTGNGGTVTAYMIDENHNISLTSAIAVGTMGTATGDLTIGCLGSSSYSDAFPGHVGMFAIWDRAVTSTEAYNLLANPYQLWTFPVAGQLLTSTPNQPVIQMNPQFSARW